MKKFLFVTFLSFTLSLGTISVFANEDTNVTPTNDSFNTEVLNVNDQETSASDNSNDTVKKSQYHGYYYKKKVKRTYTAYSPYKRVSSSVKFPKNGGSISVTRTVTIYSSISGNIQGISVNAGGSVTSSVGYRLNGTPGLTQYVGFRAKYKVEEGVRYKYNQTTRKLVSTNTYKVMKPIKGEYALLRG